MGSLGSARAEIVFDPPRQVRLVTNSGEPIRAIAARLDREGLHAATGSIPWADLRLRETTTLWLAQMDRSDGDDWLDLAFITLAHPRATRQDLVQAERFLVEAATKFTDAEHRIHTVREQAATARATLDRTAAQQAAADLDRLGTEARPWVATPWPLDDPAGIRDRGQRLRTLAASHLGGIDARQSAMRDQPGRIVRSRHALVVSDEPRTDLRDLALAIDREVAELNLTFARPEQDQPFAPRVCLFVFSQAENRRRVDAALGPDLEETATARLHLSGPDGGDAIITVDATRMPIVTPALRHVLVHAYLHRHHSPVRPPMWFNEGLAHAVAWWRTPPSAQLFRADALEQLRSPETVARLLEAGPAPGRWLMEGTDTAAAGLIVRRLLESRRPAVVDWINRIKHGEVADQAFEAAFEATPQEVVSHAAAYWKFNE
jgi:hypothetical protein